jgi:uncharacterized protein
MLGTAGLILSEGALRAPPDARHDASADRAGEVASSQNAFSSAVEIRAADGTWLRAWLFKPARGNGAGVILLHGVADDRHGMLGHARMVLRAGYVALLPDSRAHGSSSGDVFTFGVREREDAALWAKWLREETSVRHVYALGESMGAVIAIQSAGAFRAVVAECSFSTFRRVAQHRVTQAAGCPDWMLWPLVEAGFLAARLRQGIDLTQACPLDAIRRTQTPVLLIHGLDDRNIPPGHSVELARANPAKTCLWLVPAAGHTAASAVQPAEFERRVLAWFGEN